jgi:hypothetical protein
MTPKDKAEDLIVSFFRIQDEQQETTWVQAKQCALIAVDEMIEAFWKTHKNEEEFRYWQEVKQEIQAL